MNMKKKWYVGLIGAIVLALAIPSLTMAAGAQQPTNTGTSAIKLSATKSDGFHSKSGHRKQGHKKHGHGIGKGILKQQAHMENYITLLTTKYAADLTDDWEKAFAEREPIVTELQTLRKSGVKPDKSALKDNLTAAERQAKMEAKKASHEAFRTAVKNNDAVAIKTSLTNLLKDYQEETKQLADRLAKLKAASSTSSSST